MEPDFTLDDLVFTATARCACGAGLAYPRNGPGDEFSPLKWPYNGFWDCSAILLGDAVESVKHTDRLPFAYYELIAEGQASARGASTRPGPER